MQKASERRVGALWAPVASEAYYISGSNNTKYNMQLLIIYSLKNITKRVCGLFCAIEALAEECRSAQNECPFTILNITKV